MRKAIIIIMMLFLLTISGCGEAKSSINNIDSTDVMVSSIMGLNENNPKESENAYFFNKDKTEIRYLGTFKFYEEPLVKEVILYVNKIYDLPNGELYEMKLESVEEIEANFELSYRKILGYFYVQEEKIWKVDLTNENVDILKTSDEIPAGCVVVCQNDEMTDSLGEEEEGFHHYIEIDGDKCEYHSYSNFVETGYYESFIWKKDVGLVTFRSGYGAESQAIELQLVLE